MADAMEHLLHDNVVSILVADATLAARVSDTWSDHVLRGLSEGLSGRRHLGACPLLEVGTVEISPLHDASVDHEEDRARIVIRARIVDYATDPGTIHDLLRDVALALESQPQLNQPQTVVKFDLAIGAPDYQFPLWSCDVTVDALLAFDPITRATP